MHAPRPCSPPAADAAPAHAPAQVLAITDCVKNVTYDIRSTDESRTCSIVLAPTELCLRDYLDLSLLGQVVDSLRATFPRRVVPTHDQIWEAFSKCVEHSDTNFAQKFMVVREKSDKKSRGALVPCAAASSLFPCASDSPATAPAPQCPRWTRPV